MNLTEFANRYFAVFFPVFFVIMWIATTTLMGFVSGWFRLMKAYPDRQEPSLLQLNFRSGWMGWISLNGILMLSACPSGLRVGMLRIFGLFTRDFFVPWNEIKVSRTKVFFRSMAELQFGDPAVGKLTVSASIADQLASTVSERWPENRKAVG